VVFTGWIINAKKNVRACKGCDIHEILFLILRRFKSKKSVASE